MRSMRLQNASDSLERVIIVENCPCHCLRLDSKADLDIFGESNVEEVVDEL